jgi:hypothetical protein
MEDMTRHLAFVIGYVVALILFQECTDLRALVPIGPRHYEMSLGLHAISMSGLRVMMLFRSSK